MVPNTPVSYPGYGASVFCPNPKCNPEDSALVEKMFSSLGLCLPVQENLMDAVTGLSGSGPAYVSCILARNSRQHWWERGLQTNTNFLEPNSVSNRHWRCTITIPNVFRHFFHGQGSFRGFLEIGLMTLKLSLWVAATERCYMLYQEYRNSFSFRKPRVKMRLPFPQYMVFTLFSCDRLAHRNAIFIISADC